MLNKLKPTIAIIDSGIGGISILRSLINKYGVGNFIYYADNLYMPYGTRSKSFVKNRIDYLIRLLRDTYKANIIIIACNTASSAIDNFKYDNVYTMHFDNKYTYLATSLTKKNKPSLKVIPDKTLAKMIEKNIFNKPVLKRIIRDHVKKYKLDSYKNLVLGCTHYELVADLFKENCPDTNFILNSNATLEQLSFDPKEEQLTIKILMSRYSQSYYEKIMKLIRS